MYKEQIDKCKQSLGDQLRYFNDLDEGAPERTLEFLEGKVERHLDRKLRASNRTQTVAGASRGGTGLVAATGRKKRKSKTEKAKNR